MLGTAQGVNWAQGLTDILVVGVLGILALARKQFMRETHAPMIQLQKIYKRHVKDCKKYRNEMNARLFEISARINQYEKNAQRERNRIAGAISCLPKPEEESDERYPVRTDA